MDCNDGECTGLLYSRRIGRPPQGEIEASTAKAPAPPRSRFSARPSSRARRRPRWAAERRRAGGSGRHRGGSRAAPQDRGAVTGFNVLRARREPANNSNLGVMLTTTNRQLTPDTRFLAESAVTGGVDYDWRFGRATASRASGPAAAWPVTPKPSPACRRRPCTTSSVPTPITWSSTAATPWPATPGRWAVSKIPGSASGSAPNYGFKSPGFEIERPWVPAPRRRAHDEPLRPVAQRRPGSYVVSLIGNLNEWAVELRRRSPLQRRQRQHALDWQTTGATASAST